MPSRIRKLTRPIPKAGPLPTSRPRTVRPAVHCVNSSSIHSAAYRTTRKATRGSSPTGLRTRRRPRHNTAHRPTCKTILASSLTGHRIRRPSRNTITLCASSQVRCSIKAHKPVPRSARTPRTLRRRLQAVSTQLRSSMRPRRTPDVPLGHSLQVGLVSKAFRNDPLRKVSRTPTHALPAATAEGITVAVADRCWLHKRSRLDLASPRRAGVAVSSVGEIAGTETVDWHGILTLQLDYVSL